MEFALVTAIPFTLAILLVIPPVRDLSKSAQTAVSTLAMAGMFVTFLLAMPRLQYEGTIIYATE